MTAGPQSDVNVFLALVAKFDTEPLVAKNFELKDNSLYFHYAPSDPSGFSIDMRLQDGTYWLECEGWHEDFDQENDDEVDLANQLFEQLITLLNGQVVLRIWTAGRWPYKWELIYEFERRRHESLGFTHLLLFNYFGRRRRIEKRNQAISHRIASGWAGAHRA
jgi:hypothetical protein